MARKARTTRSSSKKALAAVTVASIVGYDPNLLLAVPEATESFPVGLISEVESLPLSELTPPGEATIAAAANDTPAVTAVEGFAVMLAGLEAYEVGNAGHAVTHRFNERSAFEIAKNPDNENIHRTLRKCRAALSHDSALRALLACEVDEAFIDRGLRQGAAYNVYAIDKVQDLVGYLVGNPVLNRITNAVLRTMEAFEAAGQVFTMEFAKAAASDKIRVEPMYRPLMRSHTVSASTAPTQASSTMQALVTLGVVIASRGTGTKHDSYRFADTPQAKAIRERLAA